MSEEKEKDGCVTCQCCVTCQDCQVGNVPVSEGLRKFQSTTVEYLDPPSVEEFLKTRYPNPPHPSPEEFICSQRNEFWELLKYIFLFKWLKVNWK